MPYEVRIKRTAKRKLQSLPPKERLRIVDAITALGASPDDPNLDTRLLTGSRLYRLRVGRWRIIYHRQDETLIVSIEKIGPRGDAYK